MQVHLCSCEFQCFPDPKELVAYKAKTTITVYCTDNYCDCRGGFKMLKHSRKGESEKYGTENTKKTKMHSIKTCVLTILHCVINWVERNQKVKSSHQQQWKYFFFRIKEGKKRRKKHQSNLHSKKKKKQGRKVALHVHAHFPSTKTDFTSS